APTSSPPGGYPVRDIPAYLMRNGQILLYRCGSSPPGALADAGKRKRVSTRVSQRHRRKDGDRIVKKLINDAESVVADALTGMAAAHPSLSVDVRNRIVLRATGPRPGKVAVISGGGSGHEPLHAGYVGYGMLDAACPGEIFTSPVPDQMLEAAKRMHGGAGVLFVVKNYTGDV